MPSVALEVVFVSDDPSGMRVSEALLPLLLAVFAPRHGAAADVATNEPILKYASTLQEKTGAVQFPIQGGNIFKELCSIYLQFKECTKSVSCHSLSIDAVDASYGYMCGAGYQLFEDHSACFAEIEREHDYIACKNAANDAMEDATKAKRDDLDAYFRSLCGVMDEYLRCCRPLVNRRCGREAWDLVSQVTVDSLKVTMPTCEIRKSLV
ncbi:hypothetical protein QR680_012932 [Steinernema hermaphroditum]|uniref:T20D4.11-like domain-containing protein n=1 Tax=Steinernema hermaphroditum TaxID=289476 RepID=A0AA39M1E8_9BILA|nr:hypothetical protein QR680_012932 [Steinernema hermaphroditum]